jgi:hypothetical protein
MITKKTMSILKWSNGKKRFYKNSICEKLKMDRCNGWMDGERGQQSAKRVLYAVDDGDE